MHELCLEINDWMDSNRLQLNPSKTELVWFSTRQGFNKFTRVTVEVRSATIDPVKYAKSLGVTLDEELKLSKHVSNGTSSCFYQIRQLKHIRRYLDFQSAATVVHSFVTSRFDYCNGLLAAAPAKQIEELQRVLNASARILLRLPRYDFDLRVKVRDQLHWLRIPERVTDKLCKMVYKCLHGMAPATVTRCVFLGAATPTEVISAQLTKRS